MNIIILFYKVVKKELSCAIMFNSIVSLPVWALPVYQTIWAMRSELQPNSTPQHQSNNVSPIFNEYCEEVENEVEKYIQWVCFFFNLGELYLLCVQCAALI